MATVTPSQRVEQLEGKTVEFDFDGARIFVLPELSAEDVSACSCILMHIFRYFLTGVAGKIPRTNGQLVIDFCNTPRAAGRERHRGLPSHPRSRATCRRHREEGRDHDKEDSATGRRQGRIAADRTDPLVGRDRLPMGERSSRREPAHGVLTCMSCTRTLPTAYWSSAEKAEDLRESLISEEPVLGGRLGTGAPNRRFSLH